MFGWSDDWLIYDGGGEEPGIDPQTVGAYPLLALEPVWLFSDLIPRWSSGSLVVSVRTVDLDRLLFLFQAGIQNGVKRSRAWQMTARAKSTATHVRTNLSKLHTLSMDCCAQEHLQMSGFFFWRTNINNHSGTIAMDHGPLQLNTRQCTDYNN